MNLKRLLKRLLFQQAPAQHSKSGRMAVRSRFEDIQKLVSNAKVVVDAGAAHGEMTQKFLELFPSATIHAIEPNPDSVKVLQSRFQANPRVVIHPVALGSQDGVVQFNILKRHTSSSILMPTNLNKEYHPDEMNLVQSVEIPLRSIDSLINSSPIDVLKLDLQGYELEALKGMSRSLETIRCITTEIEFVSLYENQALFGDIDVFLRQHGFNLYNLYELWTHQDGQLTAGDAVYIKAV